jgi:hypothetical protein
MPSATEGYEALGRCCEVAEGECKGRSPWVLHLHGTECARSSYDYDYPLILFHRSDMVAFVPYVAPRETQVVRGDCLSNVFLYLTFFFLCRIMFIMNGWGVERMEAKEEISYS